MLLQLNAAFDFMANKLDNGIVAYKSLGRQFSRNYVVPANPDTTAQSAVRTAFAAASVAYSSLSQAEVAAWTAFAATMPVRIDSLGRTYPWTARAIYQAVNSYRSLNTVGTGDTVPADYVSFNLAKGTSVVAAGNLTIQIIVPGAATATTNEFGLVRITPPLSGTALVARRTDLRLPTATPSDAFIDTSAGGTVNAVFTTASILAQMGFTPTIGQRIGIQLLPLRTEYVPGYDTFYTTVTLA